MYKGRRYRRRKKQKPIMLLVSMILVLTVAVGGTVAFLVHQSESVKNVFSVAEVPISIEEEFDGSTKTDVKIKHDGNSEDRDAYVRATVVANWVDTSGNVYSEKPKLDIQYGDDWTEYPKDSGYYYYKDKLAAGKSTTDFIESCSLNSNSKAPSTDYTLSVEILAQSIQADGTDSKGNKPIELAWKVDIENGTVKAASIID